MEEAFNNTITLIDNQIDFYEKSAAAQANGNIMVYEHYRGIIQGLRIAIVQIEREREYQASKV